MYLQIIYLIYIHKKDSALNKLQGLICRKIEPIHSWIPAMKLTDGKDFSYINSIVLTRKNVSIPLFLFLFLSL